MPSKEEIYDGEIAPLMTRIISLCKEHGIALNAVFELDKDEQLTVTTNIPVAPETALMRMLYYVSQSHGNVDSFIVALMRDVKKYGHNSAFLQILESAADRAA